MSTNDQPIDYRTHILIGVRANGIMSVIADWGYVPPQAEVQAQIDCSREPFMTFVLCTPTSIMLAEHNARKATKATPSRFGPAVPVRRR